MAGLVTSSVAYWGSAAVAFASSLIRSKFLAIHLGPAGIGLVSQLNMLSILLGSISTLGLGNATIKLIAGARAAGDDHQVRRLITFIITVPVLASLLLFIGGLGLSHMAAEVLLGSALWAGYVVVALSTVPLNLAAGGFQVVLQGFGRMSRLSVASVVATVLNTGVVIGLVVVFQLSGAVAGVLATSVIAFAVLIIRERWMLGHLTPRWYPGRAALGEMARYGTASVALVILGALTDTTLRAVTIATLGLTASGIYQPVALLSSQVFLQVQTGIAMFLLPALSRAVARGDDDAVRIQLDRALRLAVIATVGIALTALATRQVMIRLLFTKAFLPAAELISMQMIGELIRSCSYVVGGLLLPAGRVRAWLLIGAMTLAVQAGLGTALLPGLGLGALPLAFTVAWALNLLANGIALRDASLAMPRRPTVLLAITGAMLLLPIALATLTTRSILLDVASGVAAAAWICFALARNELGVLDILHKHVPALRRLTTRSEKSSQRGAV